MNIAITIISSLLSGIIATLITVNYYRIQEKRQRKLNLLSNILCNINALVEPINKENKRMLAGYLNESFVTFNDIIEIINCLENLKDDVTEVKLTKLVKLMCNDLKIDCSKLSDEFVTKPFN